MSHQSKSALRQDLDLPCYSGSSPVPGLLSPIRLAISSSRDKVFRLEQFPLHGIQVLHPEELSKW